MKNKLRKQLALLLAVCMCISVCPITAFAETDEVEIEAVTATARPLDSEANDPVTLTTASVFPKNSDFYVKFEGLKPENYYLVEVYDPAKGNDHYGLYSDENGVAVSSMFYGLSVGSHDITLTICDDENAALYQDVTLTTQFVESLPATLEEIQSFAEPQEVPVQESVLYVSSYLPMGTLENKESLSFKLVKDGVVYAVNTEESSCDIWSSSLKDGRYADILQEDLYIPLEVQQVQCELYFGRELESGSYDLRIYVDGELFTTHEEAVLCRDVPIVSAGCYIAEMGTYNVVGSQTAGCTLDIRNGDPAEFKVKAYCDGELLGTSVGYRISGANAKNCTAVYVIPLEEPLEREQMLEFQVVYTGEGDFLLLNSDLRLHIYEKVAADRRNIQFGSYYYANFVIPSFGYDAGVQYKFELYSRNNLLATTYASPNNDGLFNLEFLDEDDQLIELQNRASYSIKFYGHPDNPNYANLSWNVNNQYIWREEAMSLLAAEDTVVLNLEDARFSQSSAEKIYVQLAGEGAASVYNNKADYQLRLTSVTGEVHLLEAGEATLSDEGYVAEAYFLIPEDLAEISYQVALLNDGKLVTNAQGESIFAEDATFAFSRLTRVSIVTSNVREVGAVTRVYPSMFDGDTLTVKLFSITNGTTEPDCTLTLTEKNNYNITDADMAKLNPAVKYRGEVSADGKILNSTNYTYWASWTAIRTSREYGTVTVAEDMKDYLEIVPCYTNYDEDVGIPYFSEVYVNVTAPEGKALQYITVNGEKICGNGFLFTGDCEVSAIFEEAETVTFKVTVQMGVEEYFYGDENLTEAELEELLGNMTAEEREEFIANGNSGRVFKVLHSYERNLPPNSMQELDLSIPTALSQYKLAGNPYAECADPNQDAIISHDGTQTYWFLDMPECDVVVKVELEPKQSYRVITTYDSSLGTVTGLESNYYSVIEGETVSFTAVPNEDNLLQSVYYEYSGYKNGSWGTHTVTLTPDEDGVYSFVMPASDADLYINFTTSGPYAVNAYAYGLGTAVVSDPASEEGYMAGEVVTLTVTPNEGSRLVKKDAIQGSYNIGYEYCDVEFTKVDDTTYTFQMPHSDVSIEVRFEITPGVAPGGTVVDSDTLITALGGSKNAVLNTETGAVQLLQTVELIDSIIVNPEQPTEIVLDLNGNRIIVVKDNENVESGAIVLHQNGLARFKLINNIDGGSIVTDGEVRNYFHMIWVQGGSLTVEGKSEIDILTAYSPIKRSSAGIRVAGGEATLDNLRIEAQLASDALHLSSGTTTILGGEYWGGMDYYNQYQNQQTNGLNLLGDWMDYSWINYQTLGGSAIRVTGRATVQIEDAYAYGGAHGAALHIDNKVSQEYPCTVDVWGGGFYAEAGKGLLVESGYADVTLHYGEFWEGDAPYGNYSMDVTNFGCIADYLAADRLVWDLNRPKGDGTYYEISDESLQKSYLWDSVEILDGPIGDMNNQMESITAETAEGIKSAVVALETETLKQALVAAPTENKEGETVSAAKTLQELEEKVKTETGVTTSVETKGEAADLFGEGVSVVGAAFNAAESKTEVKLSVTITEEAEETPEAYSGGIRLSMELVGAEDKDAETTGQQLAVPVLIVLPLPETVNPALITVLHHNGLVWEKLDRRVYQDQEGKWFISFATDRFSDYALTHNLSASKNDQSIAVRLKTDERVGEDIQFLCAVYSQQGQMLGAALVNDAGNATVQLDDKAEQAYEVKVFTASADGSWKPLFGEEKILLGAASNLI